MKHLTKTHLISIVLSLIAFGLFVANQFKALSGSSLDLHGTGGAALLTGFLAAGIVVQFAKFIEGHDTAVEMVFTAVLLLAHIGAELAIWWRTQIVASALPASLPLYIVGLYWLVGAIDLLVMFVPQNLTRLSSGYVSPEHRLAMVEQSLSMVEQERALLEQKLSMVEQSLSTAQQSLTAAQHKLEQERAEHKQQLAEMRADQSKTHTATCDVPGCGWVGEYTSVASAERGLRAHTGRAHPETALSPNGAGLVERVK